MVDVALEYAARGWRVFPCHYPIFVPDQPTRCSCGKPDCGNIGKHPATPHGLKDATDAPAQIKAWWAKNPMWNVAIATGDASNLVVIDVDTHGADGSETWKKLEAKHGEVVTRIARTGGNGLHYLFTHPGVRIGNRSAALPGIDVRGDGGYIIAPASVHASGNEYGWLNDNPVAGMPVWVLDWLIGDVYPLNGESDESIIENIATQTLSAAALTSYAQAALDGEVSRVALAGSGTRNDALNRSAFALGQLIEQGILERPDVEAALEGACATNGLIADDGLDTVKKTIASGINGGMSKPRAKVEPRKADAKPPEVAGDEIDPNSPDARAYLLIAPATDPGNGECFAFLYGRGMRYCVTNGRWYRWNGARWLMDDQNNSHAYRLMLQTVRRRRDAATVALAVNAEDSRAKNIFQFALRSENLKGISAALGSAKNFEGIVVTINQFDRDEQLILAGDTTINLREGTASIPRPTDNMTLTMGTPYQESATCPRWLRFIEELWPDRPEMWTYIQRAAGYCLTGSTKEHIMFLCVGDGRNGKSTLLNVLRKLLGDYANSAAFVTFDADRKSESTNDLADLRGKRLVTVSETNEDRRLDEARVKTVTGGDPVKCRFLFQEYFTYTPTWKLWMAVNHLPSIGSTDNGIWSRLHLVRFEQSFLGREDKELEVNLLRELSGILNWALEGLKDYQAGGLQPPAFVVEETRKYRTDSDWITQWLDACCMVGPQYTMRSGAGYESFKAWADSMGIDSRKVPNQLRWTARMEQKRFEKGSDRKGAFWSGIGLKANAFAPAQEK